MKIFKRLQLQNGKLYRAEIWWAGSFELKCNIKSCLPIGKFRQNILVRLQWCRDKIPMISWRPFLDVVTLNRWGRDDKPLTSWQKKNIINVAIIMSPYKKKNVLSSWALNPHLFFLYLNKENIINIRSSYQLFSFKNFFLFFLYFLKVNKKIAQQEMWRIRSLCL